MIATPCGRQPSRAACGRFPLPRWRDLRRLPGLAAGGEPFAADWQSLATGYRHPDWFRDAKFGIWAHWGPQCQPEFGDWYARLMYMQGRSPGSRATPPTSITYAATAIRAAPASSTSSASGRRSIGEPEDLLEPLSARPARATSWRWPATTTISTCSQASTTQWNCDARRAEARHRRHLGAAGARSRT